MNKKVLHDITYGLYAVSTSFDNIDSGCIINTLTQITSKNPIVSISLNKENYTNEVIKKSKKFVVSILSNDTSKESITEFGYFSSRDKDKFENLETIEEDGIKVFSDKITGYIVCEVLDIIDAETHDIFLGRVIKETSISELEPMTYKYYRENLKGTSPKNAPTFDENITSGDAKKYRCIYCGYIYDDAKEAVKFEDLGPDYACPLCGMKNAFKEIK